MEIRVISKQRGIYSIYNGEKYIIYSEYYGLVAESKKIERYDNETNERLENVIINFDICDWSGYWDLKSIITRGIKKLENQFINKKVKINYNTIKNTGNSLNKVIEIKTKKR